MRRGNPHRHLMGEGRLLRRKAQLTAPITMEAAPTALDGPGGDCLREPKRVGRTQKRMSERESLSLYL